MNELDLMNLLWVVWFILCTILSLGLAIYTKCGGDALLLILMAGFFGPFIWVLIGLATLILLMAFLGEQLLKFLRRGHDQ
jgi:hypothetical protein